MEKELERDSDPWPVPFGNDCTTVCKAAGMIDNEND